MNHLRISHPTGIVKAEITLPASKSESNRALILNAISGNNITIENLSEARDTQVLKAILDSPLHEEINVGDAGTAMRFLTAYLAFLPEDHVLTGSPRMQQRPIGELVNALRTLGADIKYLGEEGFPPLMIFGRNAKFGESKIEISGEVSSQFISALMMIAPILPDGLELTVKGRMSSRPYVDMTLSLMQACGIQYKRAHQTFTIAKQVLKPTTLRIDPDWSAASYWYSVAGLAKESRILLKGLGGISRQGDSRIANIMRPLGVSTTHDPKGAILSRDEPFGTRPYVIDFTDTPDLAQTVLAFVPAKGDHIEIKGIESLRIKETDRIAALQKELEKFGIELIERNGNWIPLGNFLKRNVLVETYNDHRMAMAFAPLCLVAGGITIQNPVVIEKSYPGFWDDLHLAGFQIDK